MAGVYSPSIRMKRKEVDDVSDDFSDFSLSSPARKIRRLDMELPPIMEEEEAEIHPAVGVGEGNQERAIVVFKPVKTNPLLHSPSSNFFVSVDSDLISGFKNEFLRSSCNGNVKLVEIEEEEEEEANNQCMAVVPWVSSSILPSGQSMEAPELMEAEQVGEETMDIEFEGNNTSESNNHECDGMMMGNQGLPQWQQQHCLIPQLPQNTSTPISWFH